LIDIIDYTNNFVTNGIYLIAKPTASWNNLILVVLMDMISLMKLENF